MTNKQLVMLTSGEYSDHCVICHLAVSSIDLLDNMIAHYKHIYAIADKLVYPLDCTLSSEAIIQSLKQSLGYDFRHLIRVGSNGGRHIVSFDKWVVSRFSSYDIEIVDVKEVNVDNY